jgi:hypothetical protein
MSRMRLDEMRRTSSAQQVVQNEQGRTGRKDRAALNELRESSSVS